MFVSLLVCLSDPSLFARVDLTKPQTPMLSSGKLSKHSLCGLHAILRSFLEGCGAKEELSRHLPSAKKMKSIISSQNKNKNPSTSEVSIEFLRITATSALLQELLGGKLAATIRAFCRRAAADARAQGSKNANKNVPGSDAAKSDAIANARAVKENNKQCDDLNRDVTLSQHVFRTESDVAEELRRLCALGVFPQAELQTIRETYNELDRERVRLLSLKGDRNAPGGGEEETELSSAELAKLGKEARSHAAIRSEGELELEFCKRKLAILRTRRHELELSLTQGASKSMEGAMLGTNNNDAAAKKTDRAVESDAELTPHELAVREAADREVEKAAAELAGASSSEQQSLARARLQDARAFSRHHYDKSTDAPITMASKGKKMKSITAAYLGESSTFVGLLVCLFVCFVCI